MTADTVLSFPQVVCDIGFGNGSFLLSVGQQTGCTCIGVEVNGDLVRDARALAVRLGVEERSRAQSDSNPLWLCQ